MESRWCCRLQCRMHTRYRETTEKDADMRRRQHSSGIRHTIISACAATRRQPKTSGAVRLRTRRRGSTTRWKSTPQLTAVGGAAVGRVRASVLLGGGGVGILAAAAALGRRGLVIVVCRLRNRLVVCDKHKAAQEVDRRVRRIDNCCESKQENRSVHLPWWAGARLIPGLALTAGFDDTPAFGLTFGAGDTPGTGLTPGAGDTAGRGVVEAQDREEKSIVPSTSMVATAG